MRTFTYLDHINGVCSVAEIDTPWISRWSKSDVAMGYCDADQLGLLKPAPDSPVQDEPMGEDVFEIELAAYKADPARYRSGNASNLNKLLEMAARKQEKREEKAPAHDRLTSADLAKMTLADFRVLLVDVVLKYVPEERQETVLQMLRR